jgi:hypothetical protein
VGRDEAKIPVGIILREIRNTANSAPWKRLTKRLKYLNGKKHIILSRQLLGIG